MLLWPDFDCFSTFCFCATHRTSHLPNMCKTSKYIFWAPSYHASSQNSIHSWLVQKSDFCTTDHTRNAILNHPKEPSHLSRLNFCENLMLQSRKCDLYMLNTISFRLPRPALNMVCTLNMWVVGLPFGDVNNLINIFNNKLQRFTRIYHQNICTNWGKVLWRVLNLNESHENLSRPKVVRKLLRISLYHFWFHKKLFKIRKNVESIGCRKQNVSIFSSHNKIYALSNQRPLKRII